MCDELILTFADVQINVQLSDANELRGPHSNACGQTTHLHANRTGGQHRNNKRSTEIYYGVLEPGFDASADQD